MAFQKNISENSYELMNLNIPKSISGILTEVSMIHDFSQKSSKLDFYIRLLEEEMERIDAFKCELPHCMHLLKDAIEILNVEKLRLQKKGKEQVTEELMPLENYFDKNKRVESSIDISEKKKWMSNVQLGSTTIHYENNTDTESHNSILSTKSRHEEEDNGIEIDLKKGEEAFVPFIKPNIIKNEKIKVQVEELSQSIPVTKVEAVDVNMKEPSRFIYQPYYLRKQRRSWSKDLHQRFINAIAYLGGPQSSTPKKIRKLMNVDGLTNNEVKSHLQKHRLRLKNRPRTAQRNHSAGSSRDHLPEGGSSANL